jgi:hypothetical protein
MSVRPIVFTHTRVPRHCMSCRYYEKERCRLVLDVEGGKLTFAKIEVARRDDKLCGPTATFWTSPLDSDPDQIWYQDIPEWTRE